MRPRASFQVADICEIRSFDQAEAIISTGAAADKLHILLSGHSSVKNLSRCAGTAQLCELKQLQTLRPGAKKPK